MHITTLYVVIGFKFYGGDNILIVLILLWNWNINPRKFAHNKHISNVVVHIFLVNVHTLLPFTCQMLSETYASHVAQKHYIYIK